MMRISRRCLRISRPAQIDARTPAHSAAGFETLSLCRRSFRSVVRDFLILKAHIIFQRFAPERSVSELQQ